MTTQLSSVTRAVRAGIATDRAHGAVVPPIHLSSTFAFEGFGKPRTFDYTRSGNPTRSQLAEALAALENGAGAVVTSTGMSAVTLALQLLRHGETIVAAHDCYGGTQRLLRGLARRDLLQVRFEDLTRPNVGDDWKEQAPRIVWIETPSNPLLRITDVRRVARRAHDAGALVVVDNTFLSPALQQPIALGADIVVHSTTKYLNGHSDVVGGAVIAADRALADELAWWANCLGITGAPFDSFLTLRGIRTLHVRVRQHLESTRAVVDALTAHAAVERVYYPGLASHPGHEIARAQQADFGAMVSFEIRGGVASVERFTSRLKCFTLAESLGGVESLVAHPATMTHASMDADARVTAGISDALLRLSVGIESPEDLVADLTRALDAVQSIATPIRVSARCNPASVLVLGAGNIGRELLGQITAAEADGDSFRICGIVDRSGYLYDRDGFNPDQVRDFTLAKGAGSDVRALGGRAAGAGEAIRRATDDKIHAPIVVDVTGADTSDALTFAASRGCDLVLANKVPLTTAQNDVDRLLATVRDAQRAILYEATVGAGLPVLDTLRKLVESGDHVQTIEGCPSGTLGFLFGQIGQGELFSDAVREAIARGYAEPDIRLDLSGIDVARKALILARSIGFRGELHDARVESLVPANLAAVSIDEFLARIGEVDDYWATRANDARRRSRVLRYRARVSGEGISVGLVEARLTDSIGSLQGTDNQFTFTTTRYSKQPLVIRGPGAGADVTAAGVLNDLLRVAERRGIRAGSRPALLACV